MQSELVAWATKAKLRRALRRIVGLTLGWGIASVLLFLVADTLVPGDFEGWTGLVTGAAVVVLGLVALSIASADWIWNIPEERYRLRVEDEALEGLARDFRIRGRLCRVAAGGLFLVVTTIALVGFYIFAIQAWSRSQYHDNLPLDLPSLLQPFVGDGDIEDLLTDPNAVSVVRQLLDHSSRPSWDEAVASLLLLFFLLRVTGSLYRYMVRLASFYDSRADYLQFGGPTDGLSVAEVLSVVDTSMRSNDTWIEDIFESIRKRTKGRPKTESTGDGSK